MTDAIMYLILGLTIAYLLYPRPKVEVYGDPGSMLCKQIERPTTKYTHLCKIVPSHNTATKGDRNGN